MEQQDFFLRRVSANIKFAIFGLISLVLLLVDSHYQVLNVVRDVVTVGLQPLQSIATAPVAATRWLNDFLVLQSDLQQENARLLEAFRSIGGGEHAVALVENGGHSLELG